MSLTPVPGDLSSSAPSQQAWTTSPVVDYEPAPQPLAARPCPAPAGTALHRPSPRALRAARPAVHEVAPPRSAVTFAETALRQVIG